MNHALPLVPSPAVARFVGAAPTPPEVRAFRLVYLVLAIQFVVPAASYAIGSPGPMTPCMRAKS